MRIVLLKLWGFVKRDFLIESSYKVAFAFSLLSSVFPVFSFYFVAKLVEGNASLERYGGDYFQFVLVGVAFTQYFMTALRTFATTVRRAQTAGVLEAILSTQTSPQAVILFTSAYSFLVATIHIAIVFALGGLFLGVDYGGANLVSSLATIVLTIASFSALGILSATGIVILKKGDPVELVIGSVSSLLGGAFFPIALMPEWMQLVAKCLPITYALESMRLALFQGQSVAELWLPLTVLASMAAVLLPVSLLAFSWAVDRSRRDGSLIQY